MTALTAIAARKGRPTKRDERELMTLILYLAVAGFSRHGYRGLSLRMISDPLGVSVSSVAYHIKSKANLYSLVLSRIADSLDGLADRIEAQPPGTTDLIGGLQAWTRDHADYARIILRDLMENTDRATEVDHWYLKDSVDRLIALFGRQDPMGRDAAMRFVSILGAVTYAEIALPTIVRFIEDIDDEEVRLRVGEVLEKL